MLQLLENCMCPAFEDVKICVPFQFRTKLPEFIIAKKHHKMQLKSPPVSPAKFKCGLLKIRLACMALLQLSAKVYLPGTLEMTWLIRILKLILPEILAQDFLLRQ